MNKLTRIKLSMRMSLDILESEKVLPFIIFKHIKFFKLDY